MFLFFLYMIFSVRPKKNELYNDNENQVTYDLFSFVFKGCGSVATNPVDSKF